MELEGKEEEEEEKEEASASALPCQVVSKWLRFTSLSAGDSSVRKQ
jgi:hypothetical protein